MKNIFKRILSIAVATVTAVPYMSNIAVSAETAMPVYKFVNSYPTDGTQGTDGWYYMYKNGATGEYVNMTWDGTNKYFTGPSGSDLRSWMINPGYGTPAVLAWEVQHSGNVTLTVTDGTIYRISPHSGGGDTTATLKLNDEIVKLNNGENAQWTFANTCSNTVGNRNYTIINLHVEKGDVLYHEVDCKENNTSAGVYWKPVITYTSLDDGIYTDTEKTLYDKAEAFSKANGQQGYDGWYYYYKTGGIYKECPWDSVSKQFKSPNDVRVTGNVISPNYNSPGAIAWKAPKSGTVTLKPTWGRICRAAAHNYENGGDVTAYIKLNDKQIMKNDGTEAKWTFDKTCYDGNPDKTYNITGIHVNKGDVIYHEVDCGIYNSSQAVVWAPSVTYTAFDDGSKENPYTITDTDAYKEFVSKSNTSQTPVYAKLGKDIVLKGNSPQLTEFCGLLDGEGHKITLSGKSLIKSAKGGAVIKNLTVDGTVSAKSNAGAFVETITDAEPVTIKNCASLATVEVSEDGAGGFVGYVGENTLINIENSFNYGQVVSGGENADPFVCGDEYASVTYKNCFYLQDCAKANGTAINPTTATKAVSGQFASGEVAYKINEKARDIVFAQELGTQACPTGANSDSKIVYLTDGKYTNDKGMFAMVSENGGVFGASENAWVLVAQYNNETLVSVNAAEVSANTVYKSELAQTKNMSTKMFIWNNKNEMKPICEPVEYETATDDMSDTKVMTVSFDGKETLCNVLLVDEYPSMTVEDIAKVTNAQAIGSNKLIIGDVKLAYAADNRLAKYGDGHLMLERVPKTVNGKLYVPVSSLMPTTGWTVEYKRFDDLIIIETGTNYPESKAVVYAKDYETIKNDVTDDREMLVSAFKAAAASAESGVPTKLELEKNKTYTVSEKQDSFALFDIDNLSNFTIEGNGAKIVFERAANSLVNVNNSTNIKVNNITVEYKERIAIYGNVVSKDINAKSINIQIPDDSPLPADDDWAKFWCTNTSDGAWIFGNFMDAKKDIPTFTSFDALMIDSVEKVQGREYKVTFKSDISNYDSDIKLGGRFVFKSRWNAYDFGEGGKYGRPDLLVVERSKDVTFDGIKTNGALLMFAPVSYCDGRIVFKNCEMKPTNGDLITSAADGIHLGTNRFGIIVENCEFRNSFDDLMNTQAFCGKVSKKVDEYTFETSRDMYCRVGDEIQFFDTENHEIIGRAFLKTIAKTDDGAFRLTLDRTVDNVLSSEETQTATVMYNLNAANNGNIVRNSTFANSRRHAYIIRSANSVIENNHMENNSGAATEAANEIHGVGNEGLFPSALTFRNNVVKSEGISSKYTPFKVYSWYARLGEQKAIDGVLVENNTIDVPSVNGSVRINSVNDLYMLNNTVKNSGEFNSDITPIYISNSNIKKIDGVECEYKQNTSEVINIVGSAVDEKDIKNINIIGENTAKPYAIKQK